VVIAGLASVVGCDGPRPPDEGNRSATPDPPDQAATRAGFDGLDGFWSREKAEALVAEALTFEVEADTAALTPGERAAVRKLMEMGAIFQRLYEDTRHPDAARVRQHLATYAPAGPEEARRLEALRDVYALFQGPIARLPDGTRESIAPVRAYAPTRNVYPEGTTAEELAAYRDAHPEEPGLGAVRTVVRRRTRRELAGDRAALAAHPFLRELHPGLAGRLERPPDPDAFYAVPYALAYAEEMVAASRLAFAAAGDVRETDPDLADYLEQRARDLLTNDYEAGDAAWVTGRFRRLNAEIGAYETYDDHLLGQRGFFALSILVRDQAGSAALARGVAGLQAFEDALPGGPYGRVRGEIPIGIYDVLVDYGQARGGNTASILPNEAHITRKYGRTILIRGNVITDPSLVAAARRRFRAVVAPVHADDLGPRGAFDRTVWHEVGHYLGPKTTVAGGTVTDALGNLQNHFEELKADLVSLWLLPRLVANGVLDPERARAAYAAGVLRAIVGTPPERSQPYQTMRLMQQRWLLDRAALGFDEDSGKLTIDYGAYPGAVEAMLTEVLAIQRAGDRDRAETFVDRWARWDPEVQGRLGDAYQGAAPTYGRPKYRAF